jgi:hypothetical protein
MAPVAVLQPSSSLLSSDGGLVTATDLATGGDVERPQSSGLAMDIHVPGTLILTAIKLVNFIFPGPCYFREQIKARTPNLDFSISIIQGFKKE